MEARDVDKRGKAITGGPVRGRPGAPGKFHRGECRNAHMRGADKRRCARTEHTAARSSRVDRACETTGYPGTPAYIRRTSRCKEWRLSKRSRLAGRRERDEASIRRRCGACPV